jgi:hypothetical protein
MGRFSKAIVYCNIKKKFIIPNKKYLRINDLCTRIHCLIKNSVYENVYFEGGRGVFGYATLGVSYYF